MTNATHDVVSAGRDRPVSPPDPRTQIEEWVRGFLWECAEHGMGNSEAAEIIVATLETVLPISETSPIDRLTEPQLLFRGFETRWDRT